MVASSDRNYMSSQEYLEWEERQEIKYEYIDGEVFAMTGGTLNTTRLSILNSEFGLGKRLKGKG